MKHSMIKRLAALALALAVILPAAAQFSIGPRLGVCVNKFHFDESTFNEDNRAGFTGGLEAELMIPAINLGVDVSAMYVHRSATLPATLNDAKNMDVKNDYIEIPVYLKWKIGLPVVGKFVAPYIFTGPSFAFLASKKDISEFAESKKSDIAWNIGIGIQLVKHLQIGASYGLGITKAVQYVKKDFQGADIEGKNRYWTVTAAWLF